MWHTSTNFHEGVNPTQGLTLGDAYKLWNYRGDARSDDATMPSEAASSLRPPCRSIAYMTGTSATFSLSQIWQTRMAIAGIRTHTIDCALRFNTYTISDEALRQQVPPESIADSITVTRAFTPYQILDAVRELKKNEVVFVLAPAKQFFDGDVAFDEGLFLIQKLVRFFADAHERGVGLFVVERPSYAAPAFSTFLSEMRPLTDRSRWELHRLGQDNAYRLRHLTNGRVNRDILSLPRPEKTEPTRRLKMAKTHAPSPQMQFLFV
jgi:DNA-binding transcriptional regulator YdaS (Cro superfamily)